MSDPAAVLTRFDFADGEWRGSQLALHQACLVHRGPTYLETLPLAAIASVRVEFARDARRIGWGIGWLVIALVVFALSGPLAALAAAAVSELAAQNPTGGVAGALLGFFRFIEALAGALPYAALAAALAGAALCGLGWLGATVLSLRFAGGERDFRVRGRNPMLLDFSERLSEQLLAARR